MITCAIIGLPGCGKSTLADLLATRHRAPIFAAGRQLQERATAGDPEALRLLAGGLPISRNTFEAMLGSWQGEVGVAAKRLIIDGSPRTPEQVAVLQEVLGDEPTGSMIRGVLLDVPRSTAEHRLRVRRRGDDRARHDEDDEAISSRIEVQLKLRTETIDAVSASWPLITLDGTRPPAELLQEVDASLAILAD